MKSYVSVWAKGHRMAYGGGQILVSVCDMTRETTVTKTDRGVYALPSATRFFKVPPVFGQIALLEMLMCH